MKKYCIIIILFCCLGSYISFAQSSKTEDAINQMVAAGKLKRIGNALAIVVDKPSDTIQLRKKYENVFKKPDGTNYEIQFFIDPKYTQNTKQVPINKLPDNNPPVNNNVVGTPGAVVTGPVTNNSAGCCCSNMKVFQYVGTFIPDNTNSNPFTEHIFTVPAGVTSIKFEGWSAGGDGWEGYKEDGSKNYGGGGGGGAFILSIIKVNPGDVFKIRVPRGGSNYPLSINVTGTSIGTLTLASGRNGLESPGVNRYNGEGGRLTMNSGTISENIFSINGEDGDKGFFAVTYKPPTATGGSLSLSSQGIEYGGNGGNAPDKSTGGGKGAVLGRNGLYKAKNGGYPGGGGGGGIPLYTNEHNQFSISGYGAPGAVILYY